MWSLRGLVDSCESTQTVINDKWVPARPINYKYRSLWQRVKEAWAVFWGKADCFKWPEGQ